MTKWNVLVFMVPDKRLEPAARRDLQEMEAAGVSDEINLAVHIDYIDEPKRYVFREGKAHEMQGLEPWAGLRPSLDDFLAQGERLAPNARQALILWGHGQGIGTKLSLPAPFGAPPSRRTVEPRHSTPARRRSVVQPPFQVLSSRGVTCVRRNPLRATSVAVVEAPQNRPAANRVLDVTEVAKALDKAYVSNGRKLDILGFDSCFMAGVEVAYQLRNTADHLVASQDFVPDEGWDYQQVLQLIALGGDSPVARVADAIVRHGRDIGGLTNLSHLDLQAARESARTQLLELASALGDYLDRYPEQVPRVQRHFEKAAYLRGRQLVDLKSFCQRVLGDFGGIEGDRSAKRVDAATREALAWLERFVKRHVGEGAARRLNGVSVFYPFIRAGTRLPGDPSPAEMNVDIDLAEYGQLDLVNDSGWGHLLDRLAPHGTSPITPPRPVLISRIAANPPV